MRLTEYSPEYLQGEKEASIALILAIIERAGKDCISLDPSSLKENAEFSLDTEGAEWLSAYNFILNIEKINWGNDEFPWLVTCEDLCDIAGVDYHYLKRNIQKALTKKGISL